MGETEVVCISVSAILAGAGTIFAGFVGAVKWALLYGAKEARAQAELLRSTTDKLLDAYISKNVND